jgi:hypothetical protein
VYPDPENSARLGAGAGICPKVNDEGSRRKKLSGAGKGAGACDGIDNNPAGGRRLWGRKSKLTKPHQNGFEKPVPGKSCKPKGTKATCADEGLNEQNASISECRKSREQIKKRK